MSHALRASLATVLVALAAAACTGDAPMADDQTPQPAHTIDWDLTDGSELHRIDWQAVAGDQDMIILTGGVDARLALPNGDVLDERFHRVMLERDDERLRTFEGVYDRDMTVDDAYAFAQQLGERFDLELHNFDAWHERAKQDQRQGRSIDVDPNANAPLLTEEGPRPSIRTVRSPDPDQPVNITLQLYWDDPDDPMFPDGDPLADEPSAAD